MFQYSSGQGTQLKDGNLCLNKVIGNDNDFFYHARLQISPEGTNFDDCQIFLFANTYNVEAILSFFDLYQMEAFLEILLFHYSD